jgi:hypothetical protein
MPGKYVDALGPSVLSINQTVCFEEMVVSSLLLTGLRLMPLRVLGRGCARRGIVNNVGSSFTGGVVGGFHNGGNLVSFGGTA